MNSMQTMSGELVQELARQYREKWPGETIAFLVAGAVRHIEEIQPIPVSVTADPRVPERAALWALGSALNPDNPEIDLQCAMNAAWRGINSHIESGRPFTIETCVLHAVLWILSSAISDAASGQHTQGGVQ